MANPSHSTASPDPRNPDTSLNSQPVTPAKAGVHVDADWIPASAGMTVG